MAQPPSPTSPTRRNFWSAYAQRAEDYTTHDLPNFSFGSPGTSPSGGSSRSLSASDGYGGESEGSGEIEEEGESHGRVPRGRSMKVDTTPRPSVAVAGRSHQSQVIHSTPTKHPSSSHSSSRSPPINELNALNRNNSGSGDHYYPEELNGTAHSDNADYHPNEFHDQEHDYNESDYYSSGDEDYLTNSDDGSELDIEVSSARYDPDGSIEGPAINPRLIPSIYSSGSRSTSIRRKGSSATESYWSGRSGYGSVTGRKGSVVSVWSYGPGSGIEGRQQDYYSSEELALPPSEHASVGGDSHTPSSGEDWRRLLGPVQVANIGTLGSPDSPHFAVPSELNDDASLSTSSRADAASDFDIPYITQFDQPPDFVSVASGATGSTSISTPTFSSVSILSLPSSSGIQSVSGSSVSGSVAASGSPYTHHYSQSRSTMDSFGSGDKPMPLPPFLQQHLYQQGKKSLPGAYQTPLELMYKTPFSKSPLNAGNKGKARERPPSMMSALSANSLASSFNFPHDDSFARSLNAWGGQNYRDLRKEWVFRRERSGSHHGSANSSTGSIRTNRTGGREAQLGMAVPSQERWNNFLLGRFVVIREEVGREGVVGASPPKSLAKPPADIQKSGSKKGLEKESLNTESSARTREKGKAKDESRGDGQNEQKPATDPVLETRNKLKNSKSKSSAHSQAPTLVHTTNQSFGTGKPQQQRIVIRRLRDKAARSDKIKTRSSTTGSAASSTTENHTSPSSTSPASTSTAADLTTKSPAITVSPPESKSQSPSTSLSVSRSASTVSQSFASSSSKDDNLSSKEPTNKPSALTHIPSHPLGYDSFHPAVIVHKHSRVAAFSVSRHHRNSVRPGGTSATITHTHARSRTVIMLAQKSVQEAFTNTETTKRFMETALLMNFDGPRKKEKAQREKNVIGLGSGSEKGKRREREKDKGKSKPSRDNLRLKIRSEGQVHLSDDEGKSPLKSSGSSRSRLAFPRSPSKAVGTKSAPANVNGEDEVDVEDSTTSASGDHSVLHRRASSSVLPRTPLPPTAIRSNTSTSNEAEEETENEPVRPLRPKYSRADDYHKAVERNSSSESSQPPRGRRTSNSSLLRRLIPWTDVGRASNGSDLNSSSPSSNTLFGSSSTSLGNQATAYLPPWVTFPTREQQEQYKKAEDAMGTLKWSFENVGLLPTSREGGDREREKTKDREKRDRRSFRKGGGKDKDRENDVLNSVPHESLLMLLPLWPGETDAYSQHYHPYEMPLVPPEERMFLLVYYKVLSPEVLTMMNVNQRNPQRPILDKRNVYLPSFHIVARQVPYTDLEKSGIRLPDQGLAVSGPLEEAYTSSPKRCGSSSTPSTSPSLTGEPVRDCLMGSCYSRETGIEFDPEALLELGLCSVLKEDPIPNPLPAGMFEEEFERSITVKLTAIGSAVVEMVWAGSLALTSFTPVSSEKGLDP